MKLKIGLVVGLAVAVTQFGAGPAWAHATFHEKSLPPDSHQNVTLNVPVERPHTENSQVEVLLPDGFDAHSCTAEEGWSCGIDNDAKDRFGRQAAQVTFTRLHCIAESGWKCVHKREAAAFGPPSVSFSRVLVDEPGGMGPGAPGDERGVGEGQTFRYLVHTPSTAGDYPIKVAQRYSTGEQVRWEGPTGSETPAPVIHVG